jgi:hypothetical protein
VIFFSNPYAKQHVTLFASILKIFGGECVIINNTGQDKGVTLHVYGFDADLTAVDVIYTSLYLQAVNQLHYAEVPWNESPRSFRVGWWIGFYNEVVPRLTEAYAKAKETAAPGTELVLRDRSLEVKSAFRHAHPKTRRAGGSRSHSREGYDMGRWAGQTANIHNNGNVSGHTGRTALG